MLFKSVEELGRDRRKEEEQKGEKNRKMRGE